MLIPIGLSTCLLSFLVSDLPTLLLPGLSLTNQASVLWPLLFSHTVDAHAKNPKLADWKDFASLFFPWRMKEKQQMTRSINLMVLFKAAPLLL